MIVQKEILFNDTYLWLKHKITIIITNTVTHCPQ